MSGDLLTLDAEKHYQTWIPASDFKGRSFLHDEEVDYNSRRHEQWLAQPSQANISPWINPLANETRLPLKNTS
jgi:hypothetical protein